jgi:hypothetical protein
MTEPASGEPSNGPDLTVIGLVDAKGGGAHKSRGKTLWSFRVVFEAWRIAGQELRNTKLELRTEFDDAGLASVRGQFAAYSVVVVRVQFDSASSQAARLVEILSTHDSDAELNARAVQLQQPVTTTHPRLGTLLLDRRLGWWNGEAEWNGAKVQVTADSDENGVLTGAFSTADALWNDPTAWEERVIAFAVEKLLPLKNDSWLDEDEEELTAGEFRDLMTLESIIVRTDGGFTFYFNDGDLFWGHTIQIRGNLTAGPTKADIPG